MNFSKSSIFFFAHLIILISAWEYKEVEMWENEYPDCGGSQQSPIDLDGIERTAPNKNKLNFVRYNLEPNNMTMVNNGHTVEIKLDWSKTYGRGAKVIKDGTEYQAVQLHFHWGPSDDSGSEHTFDNLITPLELHIVHWNNELGDYDPQQGDGILVVGVLFVLDDEGSTFLEDIVDNLDKIQEPESEAVEIPPFSLSDTLYDAFYENYLTYTGSLTTPPCSEGVSWVILDEPAPVDSYQMDKFRSIIFAHDDDHNNRPIQFIGERELTPIPVF